MNKCPHCGKEYDDPKRINGGRFCPHCLEDLGEAGNEITVTQIVFCQQCGKKIPERAIFCQHCGAKQEPISLEQETTAITRGGRDNMSLITTNQAAVILGRHPSLVRMYCQTGRLPATKLGGQWLIKPADLALLKRREYTKKESER